MKSSKPTAAVIMVTANSQSADIVEALGLGANDFVAKPVDFAVALARLNARVGRKRASEALATRPQFRDDDHRRGRRDTGANDVCDREGVHGGAGVLLFESGPRQRGCFR